MSKLRKIILYIHKRWKIKKYFDLRCSQKLFRGFYVYLCHVIVWYLQNLTKIYIRIVSLKHFVSYSFPQQHMIFLLIIYYKVTCPVVFSYCHKRIHKVFLWSPCGIIVKLLDYGLKVCKFELLHTVMFTFELIPLENRGTPYHPSYGLDSITAVLLQGWLWY